MMSRCTRRALLAAIAALGLPTTSASAAERLWSNPSGGSFHSSANWGGLSVPAAADNAIFNLDVPSSYLVTFTGNVTNNRLLIRNDAVDLFLPATATYTLAATNNTSLIVGDLTGNQSLLSLYRGTLAADSTILGNQSDTYGDFLVDGSNSSFLTTRALTVGLDGDALLTIQRGAFARSAGLTIAHGAASTGNLQLHSAAKLSSDTATLAAADGAVAHATLNGAGSLWTVANQFDLGSRGVGVLSIEKAASASAASLSLGAFATGDGHLDLVTGAAFTTGLLEIGRDGAGAVHVESASQLSSDAATLAHGDASRGNALVNGAGSRWTLTNSLTVARAGVATLTIENGATVSAPSAVFAEDLGSNADVYLADLSSKLTIANTLHVGLRGEATLSLEDGAALSASTVNLAADTTGSATVNLANATLTTHSLYVGGDATGPKGTALLTLGAGSNLQVTNTLRVWSTGQLNLAGGNLSAPTIDLVGGTLNLASNAGSLAAPNLTINVHSGGTLLLSASQHLAALHIDNPAGPSVRLTPGGDKTLYTRVLSLQPGSTLDLADNELVLQATPDTRDALLVQLTDLIRSARADGKWTGPGITSSAAASNPFTNLAIALNDNGHNAPLDSAYDLSAILIKYTWTGDVNLDGEINLNDYFIVDSHYLNQSPDSPKTYAQGDLNYDGLINLSDYFLMDSAYLNQSSPLASSSSSFPEPTSLLLLLPTLFARRRLYKAR